MYRYRIYPESRFIVVRYKGTVRYEDIIRLNREIILEPGFDPTFNGISDERIANIDMSKKEIEELVEFLHERGFTGKWAHLINSPRSAVTANEYRKRAVDNHSNDIFSGLKAAEEYLGIKNLEAFLIT